MIEFKKPFKDEKEWKWNYNFEFKSSLFLTYNVKPC